jgi:hypothetical protein
MAACGDFSKVQDAREASPAGSEERRAQCRDIHDLVRVPAEVERDDWRALVAQSERQVYDPLRGGPVVLRPVDGNNQAHRHALTGF